MSTPEGRVKARFKKRLTDEFGADCWRFMPVQTGRGSSALDFILCFKGHFITVETKTPQGEFSPLQKSVRHDTLRAGGLVFCCYDDATIEEFIILARTLEWIHGPSRRDYEPADVPFQSKDYRERKEHLRAKQQGETVTAPIGGDRGASGEEPAGRAQPSTRRPDQAVTVAVTCTCEVKNGVIYMCFPCQQKMRDCTCGGYTGLHLSWCPRFGKKDY